jgi:tripartite-type tricarboxylate transporter receptor subunit TctC
MLRNLARALSIACVLFTSAANAAWPDRPVTLVVPFAAGGITDVLARLTAERLSATFKQTFIVQNDTGAGGTIGTANASRARPDGYTLFFGPISLLTLSPLQQKVSYDPAKDFVPISVVAASPFVITVNEKFPANSLQEFIATVKPKPNGYTYASAGGGSLTHIASFMFLKNAGVAMVHVPYRGVGPAFADLIAGHVHMAAASPVELKPFIDSKKVKPLGITSKVRSRHLPNVPTISETLPSPEVATYNGLMGPKGTPKEIVDVIAAEIVAAGKTKEFVDKLLRIGVEPVCGTQEEMAALMVEDAVKWREISGELGPTKSQ